MVTAATYQPFQSAYANWLSQQMGGAITPFNMAFQQMNQPAAQLAYWTAPAMQGYQAPTGAGTNPFAQFLQGRLGTLGPEGLAYTPAVGDPELLGTAGYTPASGTAWGAPLGSEAWQQRAMNVSNILENPYTGTSPSLEEERIRSRFGTIGGRSPEDVANVQAQLANQAVLANAPMALRGETSGILQRMFDAWMGSDATGNYLQQAMTAPGGVWDRFKVTENIS